MIYKFLGILLVLFFSLEINVSAQSISDIKKQKAKTEKEIAYLNSLLKEAEKNKSVSTQKLNILRQKIQQSKKLLSSLNQEVGLIQNNISANEQRIKELEENKKSMLDLYAKLVYGSWKKRNKTDKLMFIFSSADFNQAYNRFKYFQQIQEYSKRQLHMIQAVNDSLDVKNKELKDLFAQKNTALNEIGVQSKELESEQLKENQYIAQIQKKEKDFRKKLQAEMQKRQRLAKQLDKLIANQIKKSGSTTSTYKLTPEEQLVSNDFAKNKGKLPWPVTEGFISEKFGVFNHSIHKLVEVASRGIGITTSKNAEVRSVFQGVVSVAMYMNDIDSYVVIIRHGSYFTVYINLQEVKVNQGDVVKTKQVIGKVAHDEEKGSVLNFEVFKDTEKLTPELWLAK